MALCDWDGEGVTVELELSVLDLEVERLEDSVFVLDAERVTDTLVEALLVSDGEPEEEAEGEDEELRD